MSTQTENINLTPLAQFAKSKGYKMGKTVKENENGYKFLTLWNGMSRNSGKAKAENIYFGINASDDYETGQKLSNEVLATLSVVETINANGEPRLKITNRRGESDYVDADEVLAVDITSIIAG